MKPEPTDTARLEALRDRLQGVLEDPATTPRDLATVAREYRLLITHLEDRAPAAKGSPLDEIAQRRKKRGA